MKKAIIILLALVVFMAVPVLAKPMIMVTNPFLEESNDFPLLETLNNDEIELIKGNKAIIKDAYYTLSGVDWKRGVDSSYSSVGWNDITLLYDSNGNYYGFMDANGNVFYDFDHDGDVDQVDVYKILVAQDYEKWFAAHYSGVVFGSLNGYAPT